MAIFNSYVKLPEGKIHGFFTRNDCTKCAWKLADKINSFQAFLRKQGFALLFKAGEAALLGDTPMRDDPAVDVVIKVGNDRVSGGKSTKIWVCLKIVYP